jgi:hypothetical protein
MEKAAEFALERGLPRIELNVWAENADGRRAFKAWGFKTQNERMGLEVSQSLHQDALSVIISVAIPCGAGFLMFSHLLVRSVSWRHDNRWIG